MTKMSVVKCNSEEPAKKTAIDRKFGGMIVENQIVHIEEQLNSIANEKS